MGERAEIVRRQGDCRPDAWNAAPEQGGGDEGTGSLHDDPVRLIGLGGLLGLDLFGHSL